jgi:hypothetical protein
MQPAENFSLDEETATAAADIISQMPEPQEHAIAAAEAERIAKQPTIETDGANVDDFGTVFNPEIHTGSKLKNGAWRERKTKKEGAKTSKSFVAASKNAANNSQDLPQANPQEQQARAAGVAAAAALVTIGTMIGGEEWYPQKEPLDEMQNLSDAFGNYFVAKNVQDFPPGVALCFAVAMYAAPRFTQPKTQTRVASFKNWVSLRVARWKIKKEFRKRGIIAQVEISNSGDLLINGQTRAQFYAAQQK